jgi:hypothetical protein
MDSFFHSSLLIITLCLFVAYVQRQTISSVDNLPPSRTGTAKSFGAPWVFNVVGVTRSLAFCVVFCRSLFVLLSFNLWLLIIPLASIRNKTARACHFFLGDYVVFST